STVNAHAEQQSPPHLAQRRPSTAIVSGLPQPQFFMEFHLLDGGYANLTPDRKGCQISGMRAAPPAREQRKTWGPPEIVAREGLAAGAWISRPRLTAAWGRTGRTTPWD